MYILFYQVLCECLRSAKNTVVCYIDYIKHLYNNKHYNGFIFRGDFNTCFNIVKLMDKLNV